MELQRKVLILLILVSILTGCTYEENYAPVVNAWHDPSAMKSRYRVRKNDTIYSIALAFDLDYRDLAKANHLLAPYTLTQGETLTMQVVNHNYSQELAPPEVAVASGVNFDETQLFKEVQSEVHKKEAAVNEQEIAIPEVALPAAEEILPVKPTFAGNQEKPLVSQSKAATDKPKKTIKENKISESVNLGHWQWPAKGKVVRSFSLHPGGNKGIDIAGHLGDSVKAVAPGKIVYSGAGLRGYGNLIIIKHSDNYLTAYAHNKQLLVKEGDLVQGGTEVAKMGRNDAGKVILHFEVRKTGKPVNPLLYL